MPKIIENAREMILSEARRQVMSAGYAATTIRSIAGACGLAAGTVYNYFPSKDVMIAVFMLEDWQKCVRRMKAAESREPEPVMRHIFTCLADYAKEHETLFNDPSAKAPYEAAIAGHHGQLRSQIAAIIEPLFDGCEDGGWLAEFAAQSLLYWTMEGKAFDRIWVALRRVFA